MRIGLRAVACWGLVSGLCLLPVPAKSQEVARRHALLVGVDHSGGSGITKLEYAERDADRLGDVLTRQGYVTTILPGSRATREEIVRQLLLAQEQLQAQDTFVLYYAGHGVRRPSNGQVYWLNYGGDVMRPDLQGLRVTYLFELVGEIRAGHKLILLDHCFAGDVPTVSPAGAGGRDTPVEAPRLVAPREAIPLELSQNIAKSAQNREGAMFVVAASRGIAFELKESMHGIFTHVLLNALRSSEADTPDEDGAISVNELLTFVDSRVKAMSLSKGLEQKPYVLTPVGSNLLDGLKWKPFIRTLKPAEITVRQQRYAERVRQWTNQQLMTPEVQTLAEQLLARWASTPNALSPREDQAIAEMRLAVDTPPPLTDREIATYLSDRLQFLLGG
jgi:hypothetical protein